MLNASFKVDPRLASLLGENYRSTELAIKELIDNAFDADAERVEVSLPTPLSQEPIVIRDNGTGMTEAEVRHEYLNIASSRVSRKGERTRLRNRLVKGRKGIGKFAGLMVASVMEIRTYVRGTETYLRILRDELVKAKQDLELVQLPIETRECDPELHGTEITLSGINQSFAFPSADRLRRLLVIEYGRSAEFQIFVDGEMVDIEDIPGDNFEHAISLNAGEQAQI
ncbi:MAG: ATP-binding protein, partial [Bacteroidota bacterium]